MVSPEFSIRLNSLFCARWVRSFQRNLLEHRTDYLAKQGYWASPPGAAERRLRRSSGAAISRRLQEPC